MSEGFVDSPSARLHIGLELLATSTSQMAMTADSTEVTHQKFRPGRSG